MSCKIFYLSTCDSCKKFLKDLDTSACVLQDIKKVHISEIELNECAHIIGSYELLFNKRAQKLKGMDTENYPRSEEDFKKFILSDYTFLKRPLIKINDKILIGTSQKRELESILGIKK